MPVSDAELIALVGVPSSPDVDAAANSEGPGLGPLVGGLVLVGAVLALGLSAVKRQRAEGRRSKFPPIG
ncbi:MAG: hypothetical protein AAGG08_01365 [Actinomycetota bacterium]